MLQLNLFIVMTFANRMKQFILKNKITFLGSIVGAIAGYLYYRFVGCATGTCAITSNPMNATIYGSIMGGLFVNIIKKIKQNKNGRKTIITRKKRNYP